MRPIDADLIRHGYWIKVEKNVWKCSMCGNFLDIRGVNAGRGDANYCPNCGTKMDSPCSNCQEFDCYGCGAKMDGERKEE